MFSVAPKVLFYVLNVFTLAPVSKSYPSGPFSLMDTGFHRMDFGVVQALDFGFESLAEFRIP